MSKDTILIFYTPGASNWVSGSTFDTTLADMEFEASHAPTQGSTAGLLFTVGKSGESPILEYCGNQ